MTIASFFAMVAAMLDPLRPLLEHVQRRKNRDKNPAPVWLIMFVVSIVTYAISYVLIMAISRYREYAADRGAALHHRPARAPDERAAADRERMVRIPETRPPRGGRMNALFIVPTNWRGSVGQLFVTHPPLEKRIARLQEIAREMGRPGRVARWDCSTRSSDARSSRARHSTGCSRCPRRASRSRWSAASPPAAQPRWCSSRCRPRSSRAPRATRSSSSMRPPRRPGRSLERRTDDYGYVWVVVRDEDFEDLVTSTHVVSSELSAYGFGEQLLAAAFRFDSDGRPGLPDLRLQAGGVLAVRAVRGWEGARQRDGAAPQGRARGDAADGAGPVPLARALRRSPVRPARMTESRRGRGTRVLPVFDGLSRKEREQVARWADEIDVKDGKVLAREGDLATSSS